MTPNDNLSDLRIGHQPTLRLRVVEVLRNAILDGRFQPGERLVERKLCELTGVSRTSVREALRHLETEGLVRNAPNRGPSVAGLTREDAIEIYEARRALEGPPGEQLPRQALEGLAGELFTRRATGAQMRAQKAALSQLRAAIASREMREISKRTTHFYDVLLDGCGNAVITSFLRSLNARVTFLRTRSMSQKGLAPHSLAEMRRIVDAIATGDARKARAACEEHVDRARDAALTMLGKRSEPESEPAPAARKTAAARPRRA